MFIVILPSKALPVRHLHEILREIALPVVHLLLRPDCWPDPSAQELGLFYPGHFQPENLQQLLPADLVPSLGEVPVVREVLV